MIADVNDGTHPVTATLDQTLAADNQLMVDTKAPAVSVTAPAAGMVVANGETVTITVTVTDTTAVSVEVDVSGLDLTQTDMVGLTAGTGDSYGVDIEISTDNTEAKNGMKTITVTATDAAGISGEGSVMVELRNAISFTSMIPSGISLFHVPLDDPNFNTISDLRTELGDKVNSLVAYDAAGRLEPSSDNIPIAGGRGIIVSLSSEATVTFAGEPWGRGTAEITLEAGDANLIGLPLDIEGVDNISHIIGLDAAIEGVYPNLTDFVAAA